MKNIPVKIKGHKWWNNRFGEGASGLTRWTDHGTQSIEYPLYRGRFSNIMHNPTEWSIPGSSNNITIYHEPIHALQEDAYEWIFGYPKGHPNTVGLEYQNPKFILNDAAENLVRLPYRGFNGLGAVDQVPKKDIPWLRRMEEFDAETKAYMLSNKMPSSVQKLSPD